jgi:hypothetical protein
MDLGAISKNGLFRFQLIIRGEWGTKIIIPSNSNLDDWRWG